MTTTTTMDLDVDARLFPNAAPILRRCLRAAMSHPVVRLRCPRRAALSLAIRPDREMQTLNRRYRKRNTIPNVLSFPMHVSAPTGTTKRVLLGEILLSYPYVRRDAKRFGRKPHEHLQWLAIHGLLHLLDYDHENEREAREMEMVEEEIMKPLL